MYAVRHPLRGELDQHFRLSDYGGGTKIAADIGRHP